MTTRTPHAGARVLVVDDDPTVSDVVRRFLEQAGLRVAVCGDGLQALELATSLRPDLVVLDLMLPGLDGLEVFRQLQARSPVPVVMLTARGDEGDRLTGLELGADDYVTKPFSPRELVLRVASVLRRVRATPSPPGRLVDGDLEVDLAAHEVRRAGVPLALTAREHDLLVFLLQHPGQVFSREALLQRVWGWQFGDSSTVTVHVRRLREKIEPVPHAPVRVVTVFGVGYRYSPASAAEAPCSP